MRLRSSLSYVALISAFGASTAHADVTGADVWADWKTYWEASGFEMEGAESTSGDTLTVTDIVLSMDLPDDEGSFELSMGDLSFTNTGNGSVNVGLPEDMPLRFDIDPNSGEGVKGLINYSQTAPVMVVSGDPGDMTYTYSATSSTLTLGDITVEGIEMPNDMANMTMTLADISSTTRTKTGDLRDISTSMSAAQLSYSANIDIPEGPDAGRAAISGAMNGLSATSATRFDPSADTTDMAAMIAAGMQADMEFSYDSGNAEIDAESPEGPVSGTTTTDGGTVKLDFGENGLLYDVSQSNLKVNMQVPDLPFPISMDLAKSAFKLGMPMAPSDEAQDFAFGFTMGDFTISDGLWNLFDPGAQLPRTPATIALDLSGKVKLLADLFDPEAMASSDMPGEINTLNIGQILVSLAGASVSGTGGFTFDNSDLNTFNGVPRPEGVLDVRVEGANKLIDTLVNMGLLPQEQAMGARMMMGLFGQAQGEDVITSKIEVNDQGHLLANGQRLQ